MELHPRTSKDIRPEIAMSALRDQKGDIGAISPVNHDNLLTDIVISYIAQD